MDKKLLAAAISGALVAPMAAQAVDFKTSGHINRMIRFADDGEGSDVQFTDTTASRSRVRFVGSSDIGNGMKAGVRLEIGLASNLSGGNTIKTADGPDSFSGTGNDIRHSALWFSGNWGKATLGHTSGAADGITGSDLTGTWMADANTSYGACSSCVVRTGSGGFSGTTLAGFHGTFDGGRLDVLRYDSPALGPATIAASVANNERSEIAAFVNTDIGGGSLALSGGYIRSDNRAYTGGFTGDVWGLSGSFRFSQGTAITLVYGEFDPNGAPNTASNFYVKLGHRWGANRISVSYGETEDRPTAAAGAEGTRWGIGWQHEMSKPGISLYAAYHNFDNEADVGSFQDYDIFKVGTRVQFK